MIGANVVGVPPIEARPWSRAIAWLVFLAPFFFLTYAAANAVAVSRSHVPSIVFAWERHIPFLGWMIVPYWSIDVFYAASLFVCSTRVELARLGRRLVTAQIAAVVCFIFLPLRFTFERPETYGAAGALFSVLTTFDKPFNPAPSLHIALLVIIWPPYAKHVPGATRWLLHAWFILVGLSVVTTYQHHFLDVPTGALLGFFCLWLWPESGRSAIVDAGLSNDRTRLVVASRYAAAAALLGALALWLRGVGLWLLWPAVSLTLVAANYAVFGPRGFQKGTDGRMNLGARLLLAPYLVAAFVNSRSWTRRESEPVAISDSVWLGRIPRASEAASFAAVVDLCAELPGASTPRAWTCVPMLDLVAPQPAQLREAAASIERGRASGPVLVCCALGYSRAAATIATWLMTTRSAHSVAEAVEKVRQARPRIVIDTTLCDAIAIAAELGA